jgi:hypothetical protein
MKRDIKHWILLEGDPMANTRTRACMRARLADYRKNLPLPTGHFYYAGKVLKNGDIILVNTGSKRL